MRVLETMGFKVVRFWNSEVIENLAGVVEAIAAELSARRQEEGL